MKLYHHLIARALLSIFILSALPTLASDGKTDAADKQLLVEVEEAKPKTAEEKYQLARKLAKGDGMPKDVPTAYRLMLEASGEGHAEATGAIGIFYQNGWAGLEKSEISAVEWYKKGYQMGGLRAGHNYGMMLVNGLGVEKNTEKGLPLIKQAADADIPEAQLLLGSFHYLGKHGYAVDYGKAIELIRPAAKAGNPHAQNTLGVMLEHGFGTDSDHELAITWYRKAAEANIKKAQANVSRLLGIDSTTPERQREALKWLYVAAENNEITAIKRLKNVPAAANAQAIADAKADAKAFRRTMLQSGNVAE